MDVDYKEAMKLSNQLCFPLYAAARKVTNLYIKWLRPLGLTYTQYLVFLVLWEEDDLTVGEIGNKLKLDNGTLSPMLKKLESQGFIERRRNPEDERVVLITLTKKGRALQERAKDIPSNVEKCIDLPFEKEKELYSLLYEILDGEDEEV
ncbi:MAG: MarR family transcriptional regulator [Firmicutes bacterium]|nr:MarR family transcriptional regulator [Bacillota bacterium]